ncbi:hypothetical protein Dimus_006566 [Dionaea muscipula]
MKNTEEEAEAPVRHIPEAVATEPDEPSHHFNLALLLWERGTEWREKAAEHFMLAAKLSPQNGEAFRYLGDYYCTVDKQRALKCYQRAVTLNPDDSHSGESICDLLDRDGKESLEFAVCQDASTKSARAFWAFRRLGYLLVNQKRWSEAVPNLQHAIRGFPSSSDLWEALGLAYQRHGMYTAAIKSYGRAVELDDSSIFSLIESGNILLMLGSFRKGIEQFQKALSIYPRNVSAQYGLASGLLALSKECINTGAFAWAASLLEEASDIAKECILLAGNISCVWKLHGDIQLTFARYFPWMEEERILENDEEGFTKSLFSWNRTCYLAAVRATSSYQRALHLAPWLANVYMDIAIATDLTSSLKESSKTDLNPRQLPEKMSLGSLLLEGNNHEFWVSLGCLSGHKALKQHAFIRGLQLDVSLAVAWAYLGKLYRELEEMQLARQAFDRARSIDPSLALPWAGMSADLLGREPVSEAYESCLRAVQIMPIGLAKLALISGHLSSSQVFGAIRQAVCRAPSYPEAHHLNGLVCEARSDYLSAAASYRIALYMMRTSACAVHRSHLTDVSVDLARVLSKAGNAADAVKVLEDLKREGLLDVKSLQIYAISLWQLGKNDLALSAARDLAKLASTMEHSAAAAAPVSLICKLLYSISGLNSAVNSISKMPKELFQSAKVSFIISAVHALDGSGSLESVVSNCRYFLSSQDDITEMHSLIALSKLVKRASGGFLAMGNAIAHLRKALHMYPNAKLLRDLLGYLLLSGKEWNCVHVASRCYVASASDHYPNKVGLRSGLEISGAEAVSCHVPPSGNSNINYSFLTCKYHGKQGAAAAAIKQMQRWLHQEPWHHNAKYLLVLALLQQARDSRYPHHLLTLLKRLIDSALSSSDRSSSRYQKFQLLLAASEVSLCGGDVTSCVSYARDASGIQLPGYYLFFSHLQLCRAHAAEGNYMKLKEEYTRCLKLGTDYPVGWICLRFVESRYNVHVESMSSDLGFRDCVDYYYSEEGGSRSMWMAVYHLFLGLISSWARDLLRAEEFVAEACSLAAGAESCFFLCHGAICMELARNQRPEYLSKAVGSLRKAQDVSSTANLPFVSLLLAQAEASVGFKQRWERNLRLEYFSWPPAKMPAEVYFQLHLLARQTTGDESQSSFRETTTVDNWILKAIHLNPSCSRYWKVLLKLLAE